MIQFRNNVFETNSSSTHTLVISKDTPNVLPSSIRFSIREFGWEVDQYDDMQTRADYFYTAACQLLQHDIYNWLEAELGKYGIEVEYNISGRPLYWISDNYACLDNGGIDHVDELKEFVDKCMSDSDYLLRWLFGVTSRLYTGNDNWEGTQSIHIDRDKEEAYFKGN